MDTQVNYSQTIKKVSFVFGVNFMFSSKYQKYLLTASILLQIHFIIFTIFLLPASYKGYDRMNAIFFVTYTFQLFYPLLVEIFINIEAYRKRKLEENIVNAFHEIEKLLKEKFGVAKLKGLKILRNRFVLKLLILLLVRALKVQFTFALFSFVTMVPEFVCSANDYLFSYYVDLLTIQMKTYADQINPKTVRKLKADDDLMKFCKLARSINNRFSIGLMMNAVLIFLWTIISLYWIFIRLTFRKNLTKGLFYRKMFYVFFNLF
jgi:hypothetical protein